MRHCHGENVNVYEAAGENLSHLLIEAAGLVAKHDGWANVTTGPLIDEPGYSVTVYLHD